MKTCYIGALPRGHEILLKPRFEQKALNAQIEVRDLNGRLIYGGRVMIPLEAILHDLRDYLQHRGDEVGGVFDVLKNAPKRLVKLAKKVSIKRAIIRAKTLLKDPRFLAVVQNMGAIYPPLGIAYMQIARVNKIVDAAEKGDPRAKDSLVEIRSMAERDPDAAKMYKAAQAVRRARKGGMDVEQWIHGQVSTIVPGLPSPQIETESAISILLRRGA